MTDPVAQPAAPSSAPGHPVQDPLGLPAPTPAAVADFAGRTALITGATRGIGYGIAAELVARGARVVITARREAELNAAVSALGGAAVALGVAGSADDPAHISDAVGQAVAVFGTVDLLVNNAAVNPQFGPLMDADLAAVRKIFEVNVTAALAWVQAAWRGGMADHGGAVLNVASVGGLRAGAPIGAYNASKAALIHLTRQLAVELAPAVRVNAIAPAVVKTRFAEALWKDHEEATAAVYPLRRLGVPADTAKLAAFLLSPDASWITGETVTIDGGISQLGHA